jgi:hypothetical protein
VSPIQACEATPPEGPVCGNDVDGIEELHDAPEENILNPVYENLLIFC